MSHKKFGPDRFSRFDVYWIQTDKQTDKPNLYIEAVESNVFFQVTAADDYDFLITIKIS